MLTKLKLILSKKSTGNLNMLSFSLILIMRTAQFSIANYQMKINLRLAIISLQPKMPANFITKLLVTTCTLPAMRLLWSMVMSSFQIIKMLKHVSRNAKHLTTANQFCSKILMILQRRTIIISKSSTEMNKRIATLEVNQLWPILLLIRPLNLRASITGTRFQSWRKVPRQLLWFVRLVLKPDIFQVSS